MAATCRNREVEFTSMQYAVQRLAFASITKEDLKFFEHLLPGRVVTDPDVLEASNVDWMRTLRGGIAFTARFKWDNHLS